MVRWTIVLAAAALSPPLAPAQQRALPFDALRSGLEFAGSDVRAMQADDVANPAFLWVERGEQSWRDGANGKSCEHEGEVAETVDEIARVDSDFSE